MDTKGLRAPSTAPLWNPPAQGSGEGGGTEVAPQPPARAGRLAGAERHYGRHSLGLVLFIVSTGLNVSGQLYLHVAE